MIEITCKEDLLRCVRNELVPENPKTEFGLLGFLQYRVNADMKKNKRHPDNIYKEWNEGNYVESLTAKFFKAFYQIDPFSKDLGSSDTIFNCWSFLRLFVISSNNGSGKEEDELIKALEAETLFLGFGSPEEATKLREELDKLADMEHSLANFMPAPRGFNGWNGHDGKGNFYKDNDMPDLYYKRSGNLILDQEGCRTYKDWIDENKDRFCLEFFDEFDSGRNNGWADKKRKGYKDGLLDIGNKEDRDKYIELLQGAIGCLENRAERIWNRCLGATPLRLVD